MNIRVCVFVCVTAGTDHCIAMPDTQQDTYLPLSGPSDPSRPHLLQRRPQAQQVTPVIPGPLFLTDFLFPASHLAPPWTGAEQLHTLCIKVLELGVLGFSEFRVCEWVLTILCLQPWLASSCCWSNSDLLFLLSFLIWLKTVVLCSNTVLSVCVEFVLVVVTVYTLTQDTDGWQILNK